MNDEQKLGRVMQGCDCRDSFRDMLEMQYDELRTDRNPGWRIKCLAIRKILSSRKRFESAYSKAIELSKKDLVASGRLNEFGDGEFMKWWYEWFSNGGMEKLLEFIEGIAGIILRLI